MHEMEFNSYCVVITKNLTREILLQSEPHYIEEAIEIASEAYENFTNLFNNVKPLTPEQEARFRRNMINSGLQGELEHIMTPADVVKDRFKISNRFIATIHQRAENRHTAISNCRSIRWNMDGQWFSLKIVHSTML